MSQRGRSGFLSYLLLLSRVLRFEHRVEEVAGALGLLSRVRARAGVEGLSGLCPPLDSFSSPIPAVGVASLAGQGPQSFVCMEPKAICPLCSWRCCE